MATKRGLREQVSAPGWDIWKVCLTHQGSTCFWLGLLLHKCRVSSVVSMPSTEGRPWHKGARLCTCGVDAMSLGRRAWLPATLLGLLLLKADSGFKISFLLSHLCTQDLSKLNPAELTPLSPEVISRQATINIGKHTCETTLTVNLKALSPALNAGSDSGSSFCADGCALVNISPRDHPTLGLFYSLRVYQVKASCGAARPIYESTLATNTNDLKLLLQARLDMWRTESPRL